jgi:molybdopterin synthase sulfur carrier subunit
MEWRLFADLAERAGDDRIEVEVDANGDGSRTGGGAEDPTVADALEALLADRPALEQRVCDENSDLRSHVNVLRNGENVDGLDESVESDDELALFPPVSGG